MCGPFASTDNDAQRRRATASHLVRVLPGSCESRRRVLMGAFAMLGGGRKEVISSVTRTSGKDVGIRLRPATVPSPVRSLM